jgi:hypothetical protein
LGGRDQEDCGLRTSGEKVLETLHQSVKNWVQWCEPVIPAMWKYEDCGPGLPGHKVKPYLKNNQKQKGLEVCLMLVIFLSTTPRCLMLSQGFFLCCCAVFCHILIVYIYKVVVIDCFALVKVRNAFCSFDSCSQIKL